MPIMVGCRAHRGPAWQAYIESAYFGKGARAITISSLPFVEIHQRLVSQSRGAGHQNHIAVSIVDPLESAPTLPMEGQLVSHSHQYCLQDPRPARAHRSALVWKNAHHSFVQFL
jgi:hypothetical protein